MELRAENLVKIYSRRRVVDDIGLNVNKGEVVGLLGPNGAGKTTTFSLMVGMARPNSGKVFLDDLEITSLPMYLRARKGVGYLAQEPSIFHKLSVEENILAVLETLKMSGSDRKKRCRELLDELGIGSLAKQKSFLLSGGEKRRCEIARALATEPKFLLLDEPFTGIDPIAVAGLQEIIFQLKKRGLGVLITDHNVRETLEIIDRAYIIYSGKVLLQGTAKELLENDEARKIYLGEKFKM